MRGHLIEVNMETKIATIIGLNEEKYEYVFTKSWLNQFKGEYPVIFNFKFKLELPVLFNIYKNKAIEVEDAKKSDEYSHIFDNPEDLNYPRTSYHSTFEEQDADFLKSFYSDLSFLDFEPQGYQWIDYEYDDDFENLRNADLDKLFYDEIKSMNFSPGSKKTKEFKKSKIRELFAESFYWEYCENSKEFYTEFCVDSSEGDYDIHSITIEEFDKLIIAQLQFHDMCNEAEINLEKYCSKIKEIEDKNEEMDKEFREIVSSNF